MSEKMLARISRASFGYGGYQDAMIGLSLTFDSKVSGCATFEGTWRAPPSSNAEWTVADQERQWAVAVRLLADTLDKAKKHDVAALVGTPVELTFNSPFGKLESWRVLEEVL